MEKIRLPNPRMKNAALWCFEFMSVRRIRVEGKHHWALYSNFGEMQRARQHVTDADNMLIDSADDRVWIYVEWSKSTVSHIKFIGGSALTGSRRRSARFIIGHVTNLLHGQYVPLVVQEPVLPCWRQPVDLCQC